MLSAPALRLSRRVRGLIYIVGIGMWLTGVLWLLLHNFLMQAGEFGMAPNPAEPWSLRAHAAFAFAGIWLLGLLSAAHIQRGWNSRRKRYSGVTLLSAFITLILSGYLLYYVGDEHARSLIAALHWILGVFAPLAYVAHRVGQRKRMTLPYSHDEFRRRRHSSTQG